MKKMKLLIVDDTAFTRKFVRSGLGKSFPHIVVDEAVNGKEALVKLENGDYDLVLCDWEMPEVTGYEVLHWIRNHTAFRKMPFIMMTARSDKASIIKAVREGVDSYMVKPFTVENLALKVADIVNKAEWEGPEQRRVRAEGQR